MSTIAPRVGALPGKTPSEMPYQSPARLVTRPALAPLPSCGGWLSPGRARYQGQRRGGRGRGRGAAPPPARSSRRSPGRSELLQLGGSASHRDPPPLAGTPRLPAGPSVPPQALPGKGGSLLPPPPPLHCRGRTRTSPGAGAAPLQPGSRPSVRAGQGCPQRGGERLDRKGLTEACWMLGASPVCASQLHQPILGSRSMSCM